MYHFLFQSYRCSSCHETFTRKYNLDRHIKSTCKYQQSTSPSVTPSDVTVIKLDPSIHDAVSKISGILQKYNILKATKTSLPGKYNYCTKLCF